MNSVFVQRHTAKVFQEHLFFLKPLRIQDHSILVTGRRSLNLQVRQSTIQAQSFALTRKLNLSGAMVWEGESFQ